MISPTDATTYFEKNLPQLLASKPSWLQRFQYVVQFHVDGAQGGDWVVDGKASPPSVKSGRAAKADCELVCSEPVFSALTSAQLTPKQAFDMAQLRIKGQLKLALKLGVLFTNPARKS
jgi:putative sterol carrier protein